MNKNAGEQNSSTKMIDELSKTEQIEYYESLIDRTQKMLSKNAGMLTNEQKADLSKIIFFGQKEIKRMSGD